EGKRGCWGKGGKSGGRRFLKKKKTGRRKRSSHCSPGPGQGCQCCARDREASSRCPTTLQMGKLHYLFFSSRRRHTRLVSDWSSDVCSSDLEVRGVRKSCARASRRVLLNLSF